MLLRQRSDRKKTLQKNLLHVHKISTLRQQRPHGRLFPHQPLYELFLLRRNRRHILGRHRRRRQQVSHQRLQQVLIIRVTHRATFRPHIINRIDRKRPIQNGTGSSTGCVFGMALPHTASVHNISDRSVRLHTIQMSTDGAPHLSNNKSIMHQLQTHR